MSASAEDGNVLSAKQLLEEAATTTTASEAVLKTLNQQHPRLLVTDAELGDVRLLIARDPDAQSFYRKLQKKADQMLEEPLVEPTSKGHTDMLEESRHALKRISTLAGLYRLNGDKRYFERARQEMLRAASFQSWDPPHFLDVAEMTNAMAIGYDWLYIDLSAADRRTIKDAIAHLGLDAGIEQYARPTWWSTSTFNWNLVCNAGLAAGALAIADEEPQLASKILNCMRISAPIAMRSFAPDGGWAEGPGYWSYGTRYVAYLLADLASALGTDLGLADGDGFAQAGNFRIYFCGPNGKSFNFADATENFDKAWQMFWLSRVFNAPVFAGHEMAIARDNPDILHLLFFAEKRTTPTEAGLALNKVFNGVNVAFFHADWLGPRSAFVGFKGGDNSANHAHLDLGSFVFDDHGCRWALDLGPDDYQLPGYFGKKRWQYYRLGTQSHNCLTVDGENQALKAIAPIVAFSDAPGHPFAIADLTAAYQNKLSQARRGVSLLHGGQLLVQDEYVAPNAVSVVWHWHTRATVVSIDAGNVVLEQQLKGVPIRMIGKILSPPDAVFTTRADSVEPPQTRQPDVTDLTIAMPAESGRKRITVVFSADGKANSPQVSPLDSWMETFKKM